MELVFFLALLIKHAIVDVGIQRQLGWLGKEHYWRKRPHLHYGGHGIGTAIVLLSSGIVPAVIAGALDWVLHWHIDCAKAKINNYLEIDASNKTYWWLLTLDQICHYLTYFIIVILFI